MPGSARAGFGGLRVAVKTNLLLFLLNFFWREKNVSEIQSLQNKMILSGSKNCCFSSASTQNLSVSLYSLSGATTTLFALSV